MVAEALCEIVFEKAADTVCCGYNENFHKDLYIGRRFVMKKYEYMTVDLSAEPSFNVHIKLDRYIEKLNEYGKQGWRLISGTDDWKYSIFEREIDDEE